ncbi:hypothetical protein ETC03_13485 [Geobacillus sp. MMMUD3]|nr:hypothetical protein [Geobacillus sp. MMMUD3]
MREKLLHFPCVSRIHSTSERKNPPDFRREGAKCEFIAHTSDYHSVCFWYMTRNVKGKLELKEPEKLTPHLVEIETLYYNKEVTDYHRAFIKEIVEKGNFLNGIVEWCKPDNSIKWSILENTPKNPEYPRYNKEDNHGEHSTKAVDDGKRPADCRTDGIT